MPSCKRLKDSIVHTDRHELTHKNVIDLSIQSIIYLFIHFNGNISFTSNISQDKCNIPSLTHFQCVQGIQVEKTGGWKRKCQNVPSGRNADTTHISKSLLAAFAAVAVVLFLQFHWQLGFACCSMWRMRNVCKSMKMLGNEEKLCCASCCEYFCCCCFIFHLFFAQDFLDIFPFDFIWVIAQGICNWLQGVWGCVWVCCTCLVSSSALYMSV